MIEKRKRIEKRIQELIWKEKGNKDRSYLGSDKEVVVVAFEASGTQGNIFISKEYKEIQRNRSRKRYQTSF